MKTLDDVLQYAEDKVFPVGEGIATLVYCLLVLLFRWLQPHIGVELYQTIQEDIFQVWSKN